MYKMDGDKKSVHKESGEEQGPSVAAEVKATMEAGRPVWSHQFMSR